jgi:hypothetical protein
MDLSFLILNYKTKGLTRNLVKNIEDLKLPYEYELIVGDNSNDGTGAMLEELYGDLPSLKFLALPNRGYGHGNNELAKFAKGKYLLIANPDIHILPGTVEKLYQYLEAHPEVALVSPQLIYGNGKVQQSCFRYYKKMTPAYRRTFLGNTKAGQKDLDRFLMKDCDLSQPQNVEWLMGSFWLIRRSAFEELNGFDEEYFMYFEDTDLCRRLRQKNYEVVYYPLAQAVHLHAKESDRGSLWKNLSNRLTWIHIKSSRHFFKKFKD